MNYIFRDIEANLRQTVAQGKSILLLGPRQTGKTTLLNQIDAHLTVSFIQPRVRLRYEKDPSLLADEIEALAEPYHPKKPLVIIDEVQKIPLIMDVAQDLIDRQIAQLILTGSSARKLKRGNNINLLPGRVTPLYMDPFTIDEIPTHKQKLIDLLLYGTLPQVITATTHQEKEELLTSYVSIYLEEEIRAEAIVRNLAHFAQFLTLAAAESGFNVNYTKLSQIIGVAHTTIAAYYQVLDDCLVAERLAPFTKSKTRHKLAKAQKYFLFDLGVRRLAANEGKRLPDKHLGHLFEQFVILELIRKARLAKTRTTIRYWRDPNGPEVDCIIDNTSELIPIEIKYTDSPKIHDARHLLTFLQEYPEADKAYIVCQTPRKMKIIDRIYAIPWQEIQSLLQ